MANPFKLKRNAENPSSSNTNELSLAEHIADPNAHVVSIDVPAPQQIILHVNANTDPNSEDMQVLKEFLSSWFVVKGEGSASGGVTSEAVEIMINQQISALSSVYASANHDHSYYVTKDLLEISVEDALNDLNIYDRIADTVSSEVNRSIFRPEETTEGENKVYTIDLGDKDKSGTYLIMKIDEVSPTLVGFPEDVSVTFNTDVYLLTVNHFDYESGTGTNAVKHRVITQKLECIKGSAEYDYVRYGTTAFTKEVPSLEGEPPEFDWEDIDWESWKKINQYPT